MRNKAVDFLRMVFVSPECLVILLAFFVREYSPHVVEKIGESLFRDPQASWQLLGTVVAAYVGTAFFCGWRILYPLDHGNNKPVIEWPMYPQLKMRVFWGMGLIFVAFLATFWLWIVRNEMSLMDLGYWYLIITLSGFSVTASFVYNAWQIKFIVEKHG
jgi:hypothetical protein